ncbi:hypothetical protein ABT136_27440, partial [Streptomyces sp. NPDC001856]
MATTLIGARTPAQPTRLDAASATELGRPHDLLASDHIRRVTTGGLRTETRGGGPAAAHRAAEPVGEAR